MPGRAADAQAGPLRALLRGHDRQLRWSREWQPRAAELRDEEVRPDVVPGVLREPLRSMCSEGFLIRHRRVDQRAFRPET